jgi:hypothetical protein
MVGLSIFFSSLNSEKVSIKLTFSIVVMNSVI